MPQKADVGKQEYEVWLARNPTLGGISEALGFAHIFTSAWFIGALTALFLSLAACEYTQIKTAYKNLTAPFVISQDLIVDFPFEKKIASTNHKEAMALIQSELVRRRFRVITQDYKEQSIIRARRFYYAWLGSSLFHFTLVLILIGGIISAVTRAEGYAELAEGQVFSESHSNYVRLEEGPLFGEQHKGFQLRLDKLSDEYWPNGSLRKVSSKVTLINRDKVVQRSTIEVNRPLVYRGTVIYQSYDKFGYATRLIIRTPDRLPSVGLIFLPRPKGEMVETTIHPPETDYTIYSQLLYQQTPPFLQIHVTRNGQSIYRGAVELGKEVKFNGTSLRFDKLLRWSGFSIVQDLGVTVIFYGFWLSFFALLLIIFFSPQELIFCLSEFGDGVLVHGVGRSKRARLAWTKDTDTVINEIILSLET